MANTITAQDCMPFKKGDSVIGDDNKSKEFGLLAKFDNSIVPISIFGDDLKDEDADSKLAYSPYENIERVWKAGRYVGATQIDGVTIEIIPRFGDEWLKHILDDIFHFKIVQSGSDKRRKKPINDIMRRILWHLWVRKFASANRYGLPRHVAKRNHLGMQIRGHLNVHKSLLPLLTKNQVVSEYREKDIDDSICRIVYKAYCVLVNRKLNKSYIPSQIQDSLNILYDFYQGQPITVSANDYYNISYKSIYLNWKPLVDFSWQIIEQDTLFKQKGSKEDSFSIFFDMAEIWESFLRKKLGENFADDGWRVLSIEECTYQIYKGKFYQRDIIPDIILEREQNGQKEYMVFDAKYKRMRGVKSSLKYSDVDRSDLFQIHTYIQYVQQNMGKVVVGGLLYPITQKGTNDDGSDFENTDIDIESYHSTHLFGDSRNDDTPPFIIDGILCSEVEDDKIVNEQNVEENSEKLEENINNMIGRIKSCLRN